MEDSQKQNKEVCLYFQTRDELTKVNIQKVVYFEADGNYTKVFFVNGCNILILTSLTNIEKLLDETLVNKVHPFIRIGKRYVINTHYIFNLNVVRQKMVLTDCVHSVVYTLCISKEALKKIKQLFVENKLWK